MKSLKMVVVMLIAALFARAQDDQSLTRDEVAAIKKKLVAVLDALGNPPTGYAKSEESFNLPTDVYKSDNGGRYRPVSASVNRSFAGSAEMKAKQSEEEWQKEYQKKMIEAQSKGDYQAVMRLSQEMQAKASQAHLEALEGQKEPIEVQVRLNGGAWQAIDPDAVVFEDVGVIALRFTEGRREGEGQVRVFFDPVTLRETKKLSKVEIKEPEGGVEKKTALLNVTIEFSGPLTEIEGWAKQIAVKKVLAQIDKAQ